MGAHTATSDIRREYTGSQGRVVSEMDTSYHFPIQTDDYLDSSSTAKGLLWAGRTNREDRSFRRTLCINRPNRCRGNWKDIHHSNRPPRRQDQMTILPGPQVHPLR